MKKNTLKNPYIFFSMLFLIIGEALIFSLLEKSIFSFSFYSGYFGYLVFCDILLYLGYSSFIFIKKTLVKRELYRLILPILLNIGFLLFIYFSSSFWIDQVVLVLTFVSNAFIFGDIEEKIKNSFSSFISFFTSFLLFFSIYSFFYSSSLPYWLLVTSVDLFLLLLIYHDLISFGLKKNFLFLSLITFAVLVSEFFLFSFFLPTNSILLKGLFMTFIYYLYWSGLDVYLNKKVKFWNIFRNLATFILLILLIGVYSYLRGDLK